jgi:predicted esterase
MLPERFLPGILLTLLAAGSGSARTGDELNEVPLTPGTVVEFCWPGLPQPLQVFVPGNYDDSAGAVQTYPVLFYYHGTDGRPTVDFVRHHSAGRDWVLVGMTYRSPGRFQYSKEGIAKEMEIYQAVRLALSQRLRIDGARTYVGGFSKGGWVSALFLEKDPFLAGGLIMGGGVFERRDESEPPAFSRPKAIYIGIGEDDGNFALSHKAKRHFDQFGASTTLELWAGIGHSLPAEARDLRQWLRVEASGSAATDPENHPMRAEAITWFDRELRRIQKDEPAAIDRYLSLQRLAGAPFSKLADQEALNAAKKCYAKTVSEPDLAAEMEAEKRFREILERETRDLLVQTLIACHRDYAELAQTMPDTYFGQRARASEERTRRTLGPHPP